MAKYLVTGGCGFIGSHLVERLVSDGHAVVVLDDLSSGREENIPADVPLRVGSVADPVAVSEMLAGADGCFHLAAVASVDRANKDWLGTNRTNLVGTITVLDAARRQSRQCVPVVYASSAAVYGASESTPLSEEVRTWPLSAYGADKLACELHARVAGAVHGVPTTGFRFFNVYGPRQDPGSPYSGVISIFAKRVLGACPLDIHGDGGQVRDFVYVTDVVNSLVAGMKAASTKGPVYNVCSGLPTTVNGLAQTLATLNSVRLCVRYGLPRPGDIRTSLGNPSKLNRTLGVLCETPLKEGLRHTLDWIRNTTPADEQPQALHVQTGAGTAEETASLRMRPPAPASSPVPPQRGASDQRVSTL